MEYFSSKEIKKINCFGNKNEKNKIAFNGGVEGKAKNTCFRVLTEMGMVGGVGWAYTCSLSCN